jgi:hypothetical protein
VTQDLVSRLRQPWATTSAEKLAGEAADALERLQADAASKQARIDELMWEYCPQEMTDAQKQEWDFHQKPSVSAQNKALRSR